MDAKRARTILAVHDDMDPSAAIVRSGRVLAYSEEERHLRVKHAPMAFPANAIASCLSLAGIAIEDIDCIAVNWDLEAAGDGRLREFYQTLRTRYSVDAATIQWQERNLKTRAIENYRAWLSKHLQRSFGVRRLPPIVSYPHHFVHAFHAHMQSRFAESLCLTLDGSGDTQCTVLWRCRGGEIVPLKQILMPHSLGWFYAAITEFLGFDAYDGEYKVMGMASYGRDCPDLQDMIAHVISVDEAAGSYALEPSYIHYGAHNYSGRHTDKLADLFGAEPRRPGSEPTQWHCDLAFAAQAALEQAAQAIVRWGVERTGIDKLCIGGGVGLNVKMTSRLFKQDYIADIFAHPLCSDAGAVCGAGLLASHVLDGAIPEKLTTLSLGHCETRDSVLRVLGDAKLDFEEVGLHALPQRIAAELAAGKMVGWFQGKMEAGPRALGHRSILADPRSPASRQKINAIVKYREAWRRSARRS